jgi:hypothetical protein
MGICEIGNKPASPKKFDACRSGSILSGSGWRTRTLNMDEKFSVHLGELFNLPVMSFANIEIIVQFYPWIFPINLTREQAFITKSRPDGQLDWVYR